METSSIEVTFRKTKRPKQSGISKAKQANKGGIESVRTNNHLIITIAPSIRSHDEWMDILKSFDMNVKFGPLEGITRLDRWNRANTLGLNPPTEIKEFLETDSSMQNDEVRLTMWHSILANVSRDHRNA